MKYHIWGKEEETEEEEEGELVKKGKEGEEEDEEEETPSMILLGVCETISVPFIEASKDESDTKEITAKCGVSSKTASVIVVETLVGIETSQNAAERLPNVVQKPGYFKISRRYIPHTSYLEDMGDIQVDFQIVEVRTDGKLPDEIAAYGEDYNLFLTNSRESQETGDYISLLSHSETIRDNPETVVRTTYSGSVTLPAGEEKIYLKVVPVFDWLDEGEEGESGEYLTLTLTGVSEPCALDFGDETEENPDRTSATMEIKDGAILIILTDSNNDGSIDADDDKPEVKNNPSHPGRVLRLNNDDDDKNGVEDRHQRLDPSDPANGLPNNPAALKGEGTPITVAGEDDLAEVQMKAVVFCFDLIDEKAPALEVDVYFTNSDSLRLWTAPTKGYELFPGEVSWSGRVPEKRRLATLTSSKKSFSGTFYLEGFDSVSSTVNLHALPTTGNGGSDSAKFTVIPVRMYIDTDNTWGPLAGPDRREQEKEFDYHPFALGKVIPPNHGIWTDSNTNRRYRHCWVGYYLHGYQVPHMSGMSEKFTPIEVDVPANIDGDSLKLKFGYNVYNKFIPGNPLDVPDGYNRLRIWTADGDTPRFRATQFIEVGREYSLSDLGIQSGQSGVLTLYVEGIAEAYATTPTLARAHGKPNEKIKIEYILPDAPHFSGLTDEVRFAVAAPGSFYYELTHHPEREALLAVYAADAIYERDDKPEYCLKLKVGDALTDLGLENVSGLLSAGKAGLYREYIKGKYILAFAGTEMTNIGDWVENYRQAFGESSVYYEDAITIGNAIRNNENLDGGQIVITGHSLGGGLASAAAIAANGNNANEFQCYTFNSAGLHKNTIDIPGNVDFIKNYKVREDILSWGQGHSWVRSIFGDNIPDTVGEPIWIDSSMKWHMSAARFAQLGGAITSVVGYFSVNPVLVTAGNIASVVGGMRAFHIGVECHLTRQCIYGMERIVFGTATLIW